VAPEPVTRLLLRKFSKNASRCAPKTAHDHRSRGISKCAFRLRPVDFVPALDAAVCTATLLRFVHAFNLRITQTGHIVPKPNYSYAKRQRELAKKQKKEEKRRQKALANQEPEADAEAPAQEPESATPQPDSEA
jgi:hypothetical protein